MTRHHRGNPKKMKHRGALVAAICEAAQIDPETLYRNAKMLKENLPSLKRTVTIKW